MNSLLSFILLFIRLSYAALIPTNILEDSRNLLPRADDDTIICNEFYWTTQTITRTFNTFTQTITGTVRLYNPCTTDETTVTATVTSTSNHCDENEHCTSTSFTTPICEEDTTDIASCSVLPTPVLTSNDSHFYVSPTTCYNPPAATGSFQCHETTTKLTIFETTSVFTYTNCDIADFVCPTYTPTTSSTLIPITDCSSTVTYTCDVVEFTTATDATSVTFTSTSCTDVAASTVVTTSYGPDSTLSTSVTNHIPNTVDTATCPPTFTPTTSTSTTLFTGCESSTIPATCVIEDSLVTVGTLIVTLTSTSCTANVKMPGSFVELPSTTTIIEGTITSTITIPNVVSPSFSCETSSPTTFNSTSLAPPPPKSSLYPPPSSITSSSSKTTPLSCNEVYWSTFTTTEITGSETSAIIKSVFTHLDCESSSSSFSSMTTRPSSLPPVTSATTSTSSVPCPSSPSSSTPPVVPPSSSSTPPVISPSSPSTPPVIPASSSSTPPVISPSSSSTPPVIPPTFFSSEPVTSRTTTKSSLLSSTKSTPIVESSTIITIQGTSTESTQVPVTDSTITTPVEPTSEPTLKPTTLTSISSSSSFTIESTTLSEMVDGATKNTPFIGLFFLLCANLV